MPICLPEKYPSPEVWSIQQSAEVTNSKVFCLVQQKPPPPPHQKKNRSVLVEENKFICLRRAWQEHIYLSQRTRRVKEWLCGLHCKTTKLGLKWKGREQERNVGLLSNPQCMPQRFKGKKILYMALFEFGNGDWHEGNIHSKRSNVCDL